MLIVMNETSDVANALGMTERRVRRLVEREIVQPSGRTKRGTLLFDDADIERARKRLELEERSQ
jgi:DNA-binding transcriptional MerR regulator